MSSQTKTKIIGLIVIVLLTTAGTAGAVAYNSASTNQLAASSTTPDVVTTATTPTTTSSTPASDTTSTSTTPASASATTYKDGTYTANGSFYTPDGTEQIGVRVTLVSDTIMSVSIDSSSIYSRESLQYTDRFTNGISQVVVGKNIADVQVYRISGASLTPIGFNNALTKIENEAKA